LSGGQLLVGLATGQLLGEDAWAGLGWAGPDRLRPDVAGAELARVLSGGPRRVPRTPPM